MAAAEERNARYAAEGAANRAEQERMERESERKEERDQQKRRRSKQEAMYAKSGVLLDGTPAAYLTAQAETDELNVQRADQVSERERVNTIYEGNLQKADHLAKANSYNFAADQSKAAAKNTMIGGMFNAVSSGVGAYSQAGGSFSWSDAGGSGGDNLFTGIAGPSSSTSMSSMSTSMMS
jgi:membrane protein involved in colicin uptake